MADAAHAESNIIFGAVIDDALGDEVRVTVIAAGFDGGAPRARAHEPRRAQLREPVRETRPAATPAEDDGETVDLIAAEEPVSAHAAEPARPPVAARPQPPRRTIVFDDNDELDVPDFLK